MAELHYPIRVVARRTGLSPHVIRVWEKRYGAISPMRTETKRRLYSADEVERLQLLRQATLHGYGIGQIARLPLEELRLLAQGSSEPAPEEASQRDLEPLEPPGVRYTRECMGAIQELNSGRLEEVLSQAVVQLGQPAMLKEVMVPLTQEIGRQWREGTIKVAHEHFASSLIRTFLIYSARPFATPETAPLLVVATPVGQLHELGAVIVVAAAINHGWRTLYLGSSLPASEIAGTAIQNRARAVALSIVYPDDDPNLPQELRLLRRYLPDSTAILVGGRAADSYQETLAEIDAKRAESLEELYDVLIALRKEGTG